MSDVAPAEEEAPPPAETTPPVEVFPRYSSRPVVPVPFRQPRAWRPVFTRSPPWTAFRLPEVQVEGVEPEVAAQVVAEAANWLLHGGLTTVRDEPDEERVPGIKGRVERETEAVEKWRERFFEPPADPEPEAPVPADSGSVPEPSPSQSTDETAPEPAPVVEGEAAEPVPEHAPTPEPSPETLASDELIALVETPSAPTRKPFLGLPDDPRPEIERLARALLEDGEGGGGGGGGSGVAVAVAEDFDGPDTAQARIGSMWLQTDEDRLKRGGGKELTEEELKKQEVLSKLLPSQRHFGTAGQDPTMPKQKLEELADRFSKNPTWAKFLDLIGRISSSAWAPPARVPNVAREDVLDLELGADLSRVLTSEIARFGVPELAPLAYVDLVEKRLLQIAMEGSEQKSRGPILVAIDLSISMNNRSPIAVRNTPSSLLDLALVLAMALVRVADVQRRKVFIVGFNTGVAFELQVHNPREAVDAMLYLSSGIAPEGGTDFDPPLKRLAAQSSKYPGGDLLFITDGDAEISGQVMSMVNSRRRRGLRVFSLLLVPSNTPLVHVSDAIVNLQSEKDLVALGETISASPVVSDDEPKGR